MRASSHELNSVGLILARKFSVILDRAKREPGSRERSALYDLWIPVFGFAETQDDDARTG
jgi:hypothetical protein